MKMGTGIIITGLVCGIIMVVVFWFLFQNRDSDSVVPVLFKVVAAVLAAGAVLVIDLSRKPESMHHKTEFIVLRNEKGSLLDTLSGTYKVNLRQTNSQNLMEIIWLSNQLSQEDAESLDSEKIFLISWRPHF